MNSHATEVYRHAWRLILVIATQNDDARWQLVNDVGMDADAWYQIAMVTAVQVASVLDSEYLSVEAMRRLQDSAPDAAVAHLSNDVGALDRAREYTIGRIERHLATALDTPPTEPDEP